jgi:hypothetical protein
MNGYQRRALDRHVRLASECLHPRYRRSLAGGMSSVLTVNSGYE